jgi:hypothetical protein
MGISGVIFNNPSSITWLALVSASVTGDLSFLIWISKSQIGRPNHGFLYKKSGI